MVMKFRCPNCQELFSAQEDMGGAPIICPMCQASFELPRIAAKSRRGAKAAEKTLSRRPAEEKENMDEAEAVEEDVGLPDAIVFHRRWRAEGDELDMTPMVDVTFLLLIFFMVTAAFGLQRSFDIPAPDDTRPSTAGRTLQELENDPDYVIVRIDRYNTFHVSAAVWEAEQEAPSKPDLLAKLRQALAGGAATPTHLLVLASEEAANGSVVAALDAGTAVGIQDVRLMTTPVEE